MIKKRTNLVAALMLCAGVQAETVLHVSESTPTWGDGSAAHPFRRVEEARDAIRKMDPRPEGGVTVLIHDGFYPISETLQLGPQDSGTEESPIVYRAAPNDPVVLFGGTLLKEEWFKPISDAALIQRLVDKRAARKIRVANLKKRGITDFGKITRHGWNLEPPDRVPPASLTIGSERMILARWPNRKEKSKYLRKEEARFGMSGMVSYERVIDPGTKASFTHERPRGGTVAVGFDRMKYWKNTGDIWLDGVLSATWEWTYNQVADWNTEQKHITLGYPEKSGVGEKMRVNHFYFENIFEELDRPGEYFIDREQGLLYLYPPKDFSKKSIILSSLDEEIIAARKARWVSFENLVLDTGRYHAITISNCENVVVAGCEIRNFAQGGVGVDGQNNTVRDCHIHDLGAFGVKLSGGNRKTLEPGNNVVENCHIHHVAYDQKSQIPGIYMMGVGNVARHNEIHDLPHFGIRIKEANDCIVEWNEIYDLPNYHMFDGGAIYVFTGRCPEQRGTVIRNNYFRHIPTNGIYIDNHSMGVLAEKNVLWDVGNIQKYTKALTSNSGGQNVFRNNIVIDCDKPVEHATYAGKKAYTKPLQEQWDACVERFGNGKVGDTPYDKYPDFKVFLGFKTEEDFRWPTSLAENNLFFNPTVKLNKEALADKGIVNATGKLIHRNNWYTEKDPGFVDWKKGDFNLRKSSPVFSKIPGFEPVEFSSMGRQKKGAGIFRSAMCED